MRTKSFETLFLDKDTKNATISNKAILILSPAFYWFHQEKLELPLSQAKKIAPSIFEGTIPEGDYSYFVEKVGDTYWFFAYKDEEILQKLSSLGIKPSQIAKVYPAQVALFGIDTPVKIGNKIAINENGTTILMPAHLANIKAKDIKEIAINPSAKPLPLKAYGSSILSEDLIYKLAILTFVAILVYALQVFLQKKDLATLQAKEAALMQKYNLPPTSLQIKSIINKLHKIQKEQLTLRENLDFILRAPLHPTEYFTKLDFAKFIIFTIKLSNPKRAESLKNYFVKKLHILQIRVENNQLFVKCRR